MGAATNYQDLLARRIDRVTSRLTAVDKATDGAWYMLVDLSNASGSWKHKAPGSAGGPPAGSGIVLYGARAVGRSVSASDVYKVNFAVVCRVDATNADLAIFSPYEQESFFPIPLDLSVASGKLRNGFATLKTNDTAVQSDVNLKDPANVNVLPEVGDLLFQVISNAGGTPTGNIAFAEATALYTVDKLR